MINTDLTLTSRPVLEWMTAHYIEETLNKEMGEW